MSPPKVYVAASSLTRVARYFGKSCKDLIADLLNDLSERINIEDVVDYVVISNVFSDSLLNQLDISSVLIQELGLTPKPAVRVETGETSGLSAIKYAFTLVKSGTVSTVLVIGVEKVIEFPTTVVNKHMIKLLNQDVEGRYDITLADEAALLMRLYMREYGYSRDELTIWPIKMHENALENPYAQLRNRITKDQVLASQVVSDPIRLLDTYPLGDGAAAILLTSREDLPTLLNSEPVELVDVIQATAQPLNRRDEVLDLPATKHITSKLRDYGVDLADSLIEVHDSYSILGYLILEELGLAKPGKAPSVVADLKNVNRSGGLKARGHPIGATGVYQVAELHKMLTEGLGSVRLGYEWGLAHSMSGIDNNSSIAIVRRCT